MAIVSLLPSNVLFMLAVLLIAGLSYLVYKVAYGTDIPVLPGIPELPGAVPFYGNLKGLGDDHATAFQREGKQINAEVIQAKLGNRRIIVLNSYLAAQEWIIKNASATIDRPLFWTFHGILSKSQGGTIGTAPWSDSAKRRRTAVGIVMTRPAIQEAGPLLDLETSAVVEGLFEAAKSADGKTGIEVDPRIYLSRQALNLTLMMCYSSRIASVEDPLLHNILDVAHSVSSFRSTNNNPQDYVPLLRYLPTSERTKIAIADRNRRDLWLDQLLQKVQVAIDEGKKVKCLSEGLLRDESNTKLSKEELKSINVSLVSGGFETLATTSLAGIGYLASDEGLEMQERAYKAIMEVYDTPREAWERAISEETVPYVVALVREMLRHYAALPILPPRQTMKSFNWRGTTVPKGLSVYMNAQAINHDPLAYGADADIFRPERWLDEKSRSSPQLPHHFSLGAGSRVCTAVALTNRVMYATMVRLIVSFKISASKTSPPVTDYIDYNEDRSGQTAICKRYKIVLEEREQRGTLLGNIERSQAKTEGLAI